MGKHKNSRQEKLIVNFMETHPEMAKGCHKGNKAEYEELWEELSKELNKAGPPTKDCCYWKKSWSDWKANIRRRINIKRAEEAHPDGTYSVKLTKAEETLIRVCQLDEGLGSTTSIQDSTSVSNYDDEDESLMDIILGDEKPNKPLGIPTHSTTTTGVKNIKKLKRERDHSPDTTKEHNNDSSECESYKDFSKCLEQVSKVATNLAVTTVGSSEIFKSIADSLDGYCTLCAEQNKETARHNRVMEDLMREKISIKMRSLELQELQYKMTKEKLDKERIKKERE